MALRSNGNMARSVGVQHFGASAYLSAIPSGLQSNYAHTNRIRNLTAGEGITSELVGLPSGERHPVAWMMPQKSGALAARNTVVGIGAASATGQSGYNIEGTITGAGDIPNSVSIGLIVSIAAALTASGGISSAETEALAAMVAELTGAGSVDATAAGLAELGAVLAGAGLVTANNTALMSIAATIRGYSDLTPEGIRDTVWTALLDQYPDAGTAGKALSVASSGGVDLGALAAAVHGYMVEGGHTFEEVTRIIASALAGTSQKAGSTITFKGIDGTTDRILGSFDAENNRTGVVLNGG